MNKRVGFLQKQRSVRQNTPQCFYEVMNMLTNAPPLEKRLKPRVNSVWKTEDRTKAQGLKEEGAKTLIEKHPNPFTPHNELVCTKWHFNFSLIESQNQEPPGWLSQASDPLRSCSHRFLSSSPKLAFVLPIQSPLWILSPHPPLSLPLPWLKHVLSLSQKLTFF